LRFLVQLDLSRNPVGHAGARALTALEALVDLRVGECGLGPGSVKALVKLPGLVHLDLSGNAIGSGGVQSLVRRAEWVRLWLQRCGLSDRDLQSLARLRGIERLALDGNGLSGPACAWLVQALPESVIT
jgi:Ran GTPase-activating protein (RanGAP) involved in mRNA processing and transport